MTAANISDARVAVACRNVTLRHGDRVVLDSASLSIPAGCFAGLLGPNGAGKTTLLRALLGLVKPTSGAIRIFGQAPMPGRHDIGYMPQSRAPIVARLTGRDMLASAWQGGRWGLPVTSRAGRVQIEEALACVDAEHLADRRLDRLSGGERQRLRLAQALMGTPRLLLLDEPLASLDPARMRDAALQIRDVARRHGMTVICSAHDIDPLLGAMDTVLYVARGQTRQGSVDEVVTTESLSDLYGAPVEVFRSPSGRIFVGTEAA